MNTDIRIAVDFFAHHKTRKLKKRVGSDGVLSLIQLWTYAAKLRPDGDLDGMSEEDIELAADWLGEDGAFVAALVDVGFLECVDGRYILHDWLENNPWAGGSDARSDASRFSRMARSFPNEYQTLVQAGIKGISKADYEELKLAKNPSTIVQRIINDISTTVERPLNGRNDVVPNRSNESNERPSPAPSPSPVLVNTRVCLTARGQACTREASSVPEMPLKDETEEKNGKSLEMRQPSLAFDQFFEAYPEAFRGGRLDAEREWVTLEARRALPGLPRILDTLTQWENSEGWKQEGGRYIPSAANFLKREYWQRKPQESLKPPEHCGRDKVAASGCFDRPQANTVAQRRMQDYDDMAKMLLRARRSGHAYDKHDASIAGQSGPALPAGGQNPCTVADSGRRLG